MTDQNPIDTLEEAARRVLVAQIKGANLRRADLRGAYLGGAMR